MNAEQLLFLLGLVVVTSPGVLLLTLGIPMLVGIDWGESTQAHFTNAAVTIGLLASVAVLAIMLMTGSRYVPIELGNWVSIDQEHFHFHLKFVFDRLSVPFVILTYVLCGTVSAFASVYLHRESGFRRFFLLYVLFLLGMVVSALAGTIETLFFGWELVGLSSALLVAYFHERPEPVRNGFRVWIMYRIADAAFLVAALALHRMTGAGDFEVLMGDGNWPNEKVTIEAWPAFVVGLLLLLAAAGKSGMVPFSGWLPRAMEGPTPSSAVFYGALSVHLGTYLLLRVSPLLEVSMLLQVAVIFMGLISAFFGTIASRVQSDAKNALAYASLTQVGIITVEIGLGFRYLALIHMIGHACLRTLQLLRSPSVLKDHQMLENAVGRHLTGDDVNPPQPATGFQIWLYRFALERGHLDSILNDYIVRPFTSIFLRFNRWEKQWNQFLSGHAEAEDTSALSNGLEEEIG